MNRNEKTKTTEWTQWHACIQFMQELANIEFDDGLTDQELNAAEQRFEFTFPNDLRQFLSLGMPSGGRFPNWRKLDDPKFTDRFGHPFSGVLFDVQNNNFWMNHWGDKPTDKEVALEIATRKVNAAPKLIPIFSHRMIPETPTSAGNPVYSVHQTDIIIYGIDLRDYLIHEFATESIAVWPITDDFRKIDFWHDIIVGNFTE